MEKATGFFYSIDVVLYNKCGVHHRHHHLLDVSDSLKRSVLFSSTSLVQLALFPSLFAITHNVLGVCVVQLDRSSIKSHPHRDANRGIFFHVFLQRGSFSSCGVPAKAIA